MVADWVPFAFRLLTPFGLGGAAAGAADGADGLAGEQRTEPQYITDAFTDTALTFLHLGYDCHGFSLFSSLLSYPQRQPVFLS